MKYLFVLLAIAIGISWGGFNFFLPARADDCGFEYDGMSEAEKKQKEKECEALKKSEEQSQEKKKEKEKKQDDEEKSTPTTETRVVTETIIIEKEVPVKPAAETAPQVIEVLDPAYVNDTDSDLLVDALDPDPEVSQQEYFTDTDLDGVPNVSDAHPGEDDFMYFEDAEDMNHNGLLDIYETE